MEVTVQRGELAVDRAALAGLPAEKTSQEPAQEPAEAPATEEAAATRRAATGPAFADVSSAATGRTFDVAAASFVVGPAFFSSWSANGAFTDGAAAVGARFGRTVSVFGDRAAATRQALTASDLGTTQTFVRTSAGWARQFTFTTPVDRFPVAVVGSNWLGIGEPCGTPSASCHGRVKLFMRTSTGWFEWAHLGGTASEPWDYGIQLAMDGDKLVVGGGGGVRAYAFGHPLWIEIGSLALPASDYVNPALGYSLSMSGGSVAVGAPSGTRVVGGTTVRSPGFVHVYQFAGAVVTTLTGVGLDRALTSGLGFGASVALSGARLAVAAPEEVGRQRTVYVFGRSSAGIWSLSSVISGPDASRTATAVSLSGGNLVVTSSVGPSGVAGVARFYELPRFGPSLTTEISLTHDWAPVSVAGARAVIGQPQFFSDIGTVRAFVQTGPVIATFTAE